jgi:response regulator RpfG family c-di-GMP phosphodiesterase
VSRTTADERQSTKTLDDVRVMVVDDHDLFRTGLKNLLEEQGVNIVGEAPNGQTAIRLASDRVSPAWRQRASWRGSRRSHASSS